MPVKIEPCRNLTDYATAPCILVLNQTKTTQNMQTLALE